MTGGPIGFRRGLRRWAATFLTGALLLAMGTPAYLAHAQPSAGFYLLQPWIFVLQGLPYGVAAILWIPSWAWGSDSASVFMSAILLAAALVLYLPVVLAPGRWGGDMVGLASIVISVTTTVIVVTMSGLVALRSGPGRA